MKKKLKKILKYGKLIFITLILICTFICSSIIIETTNSYAVSGHGTSHSSDGSHSSSGSRSSSHKSSSSSRRSSSKSSSNSSGSSSSKFMGVLCIFIWFLIIFYIMKSNKKRKLPRNTSTKVHNDKDIENKIKAILPDFDKKQFITDSFNTFVEIQNAWTALDITPVQDKLTDELFNMYQSQIDGMELKGEKNVMADMKMLNAWLKDVSNENGIITITTGFVIDQIDYMADIQTGKVTSGSDTIKMRVTYDMKFRMAIDSKAKLNKCPNCGADISNSNSSTICEYCRSKLVLENTKWVLTELTVLDQK